MIGIKKSLIAAEGNTYGNGIVEEAENCSNCSEDI